MRSVQHVQSRPQEIKEAKIDSDPLYDGKMIEDQTILIDSPGKGHLKTLDILGLIEGLAPYESL